MNLPKITIKISRSKVPEDEVYTINSSRDANKVFKAIFDADTILWTEESVILCLNRKNDVIGYHKLSSGGMTGTVVDSRVIFTIALKTGATSIILAHNHPSGNLKPSEADKRLTTKIKEAGRLLDIDLLDHLIITDESYYSLADNDDM